MTLLPKINPQGVVMADLPPPPPSHYEHIIADASVQTPNDQDLLNCAREIKQIFDDGFQWSDLGLMVDEAMDFVEAYDGLTLDQKRNNILAIVNHVIDITDTPYLPDRIFDPIFKDIMPAFVDMAMNTFKGKLTLNLGSRTFAGVPSEELLRAFAKQIKDVYGDGFQWSDLGSTVQICVEFIAAYRDLDQEGKKKSTIDLLNYVIEMTDTPYLPDSMADPVMKKMVPSFVNLIFKLI